ncbi:MAG: DNA polymerase III subunit gamma/tau [Actinomycetota bacterium]|jgi:DNA polymerase-3 subunit gamma/tau|nr:DNA polymerase III subunit gamma/tau [Actinomycetota bacterium]
MADDPHSMLYTRFRPGRFSELRGQPHVVRALQSAVQSGHVAHAYLFSGERGTGKTSTARILAKALNCADPVDGEPCGTCRSCEEISGGRSVNVFELDAASNNGVDAIRDLISHAALATPGRWKVYIIDEVHALSNAAAGALLKTLEEPPGHVIFVLATTEPHRVLATIRSRTQHLEFRLLGAETLSELVSDVNTAAGLSLDERTLARVVHEGRGSARDALSALDRAAASGTLDEDEPELGEVIDALAEEDPGRVLVAVGALHEAGTGPQQLAAGLVDELRQTFLVALAPELAGVGDAERPRLVAQADRLGLSLLVRCMEVLGRAMVDMRDAPDPRVVLEVALVRLARADLDDSPAALLERLARVERAVAGMPAGRPEQPHAPASTPGHTRGAPGLGAPKAGTPASSSTPAAAPAQDIAPAAEVIAPPQDIAPAAEDIAPGPAGELDRDHLVQAWGDHILRALPARARALYTGGRYVSVTAETAVFALPNAPHLERCEEVRAVVEQALAGYFGAPVRLELVVDGAASGRSAPSSGARGRGVRAPGPGEAPGGPTRSKDAPSRGVRSGPDPTGPPGGPRDGVAGGPPGGPPGEARGVRPDDEEIDDPDEMGQGAAQDVESVAEARLLDAFPGAEEVSG